MEYFVLPACCIAFNAKVGSSSLACAIVRTFYPEIEQQILKDHRQLWGRFSPEFIAKLPESFQKLSKSEALDSFGVWQRICPKTTIPQSTILLPVRDPIERFKSAIIQLELDADTALHALETGNPLVILNTTILLHENIHFIHQANFVVPENTKLYNFPNQLKELAKEANLPWPLPTLNESERAKPILTQEQIARVRRYYDIDEALMTK